MNESIICYWENDICNYDVNSDNIGIYNFSDYRLTV